MTIFTCVCGGGVASITRRGWGRIHPHHLTHQEDRNHVTASLALGCTLHCTVFLHTGATQCIALLQTGATQCIALLHTGATQCIALLHLGNTMHFLPAHEAISASHRDITVHRSPADTGNTVHHSPTYTVATQCIALLHLGNTKHFTPAQKAASALLSCTQGQHSESRSCKHGRSCYRAIQCISLRHMRNQCIALLHTVATQCIALLHLGNTMHFPPAQEAASAFLSWTQG
jgi:hypothetical protein